MRTSSIIFRFLCAALLTLVAGVLLARWALLEIEAHTANNNLFMRHRLREMIAALPQIAAIKTPVALVFGASDMEIEFHPDVFDQTMAQHGQSITSFNLAVRNGMPIFAGLVVRVAYSGIKPELSIVKFSPSFLTQKAKPLWRVTDDVRSSLVAKKQLIAMSRVVPNRAATLGMVRYLFDGMSPAMARYYVSDWLSPGRKFKFSENSPLLFRNRQLNTDPAWDFARQGFFYFGLPDTKKLFDEVLSEYEQPSVQAEVASYHRSCCDIEQLHFDVDLIHSFIVSVRLLQKISKKVVLVYYPDNVARSEETRQRLFQVMEAVAQQAGASLLNLDDGFSASDYIDPVHLTWDGGVKLSKRIADQLPR